MELLGPKETRLNLASGSSGSGGNRELKNSILAYCRFQFTLLFFYLSLLPFTFTFQKNFQRTSLFQEQDWALAHAYVRP